MSDWDYRARLESKGESRMIVGLSKFKLYCRLCRCVIILQYNHRKRIKLFDYLVCSLSICI
jgi:hypothetical protein